MYQAGSGRMGLREEAGGLMQALILWPCLLLCISVMVISLGGCDKGKNSDSAIVDIAKKEAIKREAWEGRLEVDVSKTNEGWEATVWRAPKTPGGFVVVTISSDKKVTDYRKGK